MASVRRSTRLLTLAHPAALALLCGLVAPAQAVEPVLDFYVNGQYVKTLKDGTGQTIIDCGEVPVGTTASCGVLEFRYNSSGYGWPYWRTDSDNVPWLRAYQQYDLVLEAVNKKYCNIRTNRSHNDVVCHFELLVTPNEEGRLRASLSIHGVLDNDSREPVWEVLVVYGDISVKGVPAVTYEWETGDVVGSCVGGEGSWVPGPWAPDKGCGAVEQARTVSCAFTANSGQQTREVFCRRSDGEIVDDDLCDENDKPSTTVSCTPSNPAVCGAAPATTRTVNLQNGCACEPDPANGVYCLRLPL